MAVKVHHRVRLARFALNAQAHGGEVRPGTVQWNVAGNCTSPIYREIQFRDTKSAMYQDADILDPSWRATAELEVRCRKCENCLRARASHWRLRALAETSGAVRTWFGSLTLTPEAQYRALCLARRESAIRGYEWEEMSEGQQLTWRNFMIAPEITKYLKRVRKESAAPFRYILVMEAHKSGLPHYHMLLHESSPIGVRHRTLQSQWTLGFSAWKLADKRAAFYVTKYLTKSLMARVRASKNYGRNTIASESDSVINPTHQNIYSNYGKENYGSDDCTKASGLPGFIPGDFSALPRLSEGCRSPDPAETRE